MDKLKARNIPPALQEAMEETAPEQMVEQEIPMVQISAEEWMKLNEAVRRMEALSAELSAQKAVLSSEASRYTERMMKAAEAQKETTETALHKVTKEAANRLGKRARKLQKLSTEESFGTKQYGGFVSHSQLSRQYWCCSYGRAWAWESDESI